MDLRPLVDNIIGYDHRWAADVTAMIDNKHGLYNASIWALLDFPVGERILDIGPMSGLSSCHLMANDNDVTVVETRPFNADQVSAEQAVDLMSLLYYSLYNEKMPEFEFIKGSAQYVELGEYDRAYFFFPHPGEITPDQGYGGYNITKLLRKVLPAAKELTIVTERPNPVLLDGQIERHHGKRGRLTKKTIDDFAWKFPIALPEYDINIIVHKL